MRARGASAAGECNCVLRNITGDTNSSFNTGSHVMKLQVDNLGSIKSINSKFHHTGTSIEGGDSVTRAKEVLRFFNK